MNKIECRLRNGVTLYDLPVGAIFARRRWRTFY